MFKNITNMANEAVKLKQVEVKVLADSISPEMNRITTFQLKYPRFIHSEFMTHRLFGRNASSSRAIPINIILKQVWTNPATPFHWGANQSGMQANTELQGFKRTVSKYLWKTAGRCACCFAWGLMKLGAHKQVVNRVLEPWQFIHVVMTSTDDGLNNFFELRDHADAQPEIHVLARVMRQQLNESTPVELVNGQWHLPYVTEADVLAHDVETLKKVSAARCCRVSYMNHDGKQSTVEKDLALCERLVGSEPLHASPFEHQATPDTFDTRTEQWGSPAMHGNLKGWNQFRKYIEVQTWLNKGKK